ncbi:hypothetical protein PAESOLCIP111_04420 [Paenibacillus solanacearum]|uniref:Pyridoxamine 5'-phosphate oxidase N-terminal domain-containing protein n=1 Tax=Paenibacillus solanacearum TaxID=2048548 RepID=A0A916NYB3_9BACL|nr:MSMEG_1061 family FMN-dependent PPOX-type flavoprotein [Paenibacillus solanacearum]CAG7643086.1 hypothetical protein PAESOLCIP111_04420 [Paenibacillus solanacearum]
MEKLDVRNHVVQTSEELRELVGTPHEAVVKKSIAMISEQAQSFIKQSPMLFMSTASRSGQCDVSPRGDEPGFVYVANSQQLIIPDRPGNKRVDSLNHIVDNPHVGLLFVIPGMEEVLRVNGRAVIIREHPVLEHLKFKGKAPLLGILVDVEACFIHCPRALKHAGIWNHESWPPKDQLPSSMDIFHAHLRINGYKVD